MLKRFTAIVVIALALFAGAFVTGARTHDTAIAPVHPPTAQAVVDMPAVQLVSFSSCPLGQGCIYTDVNGGGSVYHVIFSQLHGCTPLTGVFNNTMSSSIETVGSGWHFEFWDTGNCTGGGLFSPWIQPDDTSADWSAGLSVHNDLASSFEMIRN